MDGVIVERDGAACRRALRAFAESSFAGWVGLPRGCTMADVTDAFPLLNQGVGSGHLGRSQRQAEFRMVVAEGYAQPVRAWFDAGSLIMLDAEQPEPGFDLSGLLEKLGPPDALLDFFWDVIEIEKGERVYAARGIVFFVNPGNGRLLRLTVFNPTTLDEYYENLRLEFRMREF